MRGAALVVFCLVVAGCLGAGGRAHRTHALDPHDRGATPHEHHAAARRRAILHPRDAAGHMPLGVAFGPDVFYVASPMKLAKIGLVLQRLCDRLDKPHIVLYHLNVLRDYNGDAATGEFVHRLANQTMRQEVPLACSSWGPRTASPR